MAKDSFPQDRGWAWCIVCGAFVCVFFMVGTAKSTGMFLTEFQDHFNVPTSLAAMLMGGSAIVYALLAPVCIMLGQTFTVRKVIMVGGCIGFAGMSIGSLLFSMEYVIATFGICFGIGNASIYGNCLVILGLYFHKRRTLANGLALAGSAIGQFAMPPFIEFLLEMYGLQGCLLMVAGVYFNVVAAASLFRPVSFWASPDDASVPLQSETAKDDENHAEEEEGKGAAGINGHLIHSADEAKSLVDGEVNRHIADGGRSGERKKVASAAEAWTEGGAERERGGVAEEGEGYSTSPVSPLVSSIRDGGDSEWAVRSLRQRPHTTSMASLYGSSLFCETAGLDMMDKDGQVVIEEETGLGQSGGEKQSFWHKVLAMFDFSVMKSYVAVFILLVNFLSFFGYFNFILFLPATVLSRGVTKYDKAILISICGIGDLIGRLCTAAIGDRNLITRYKLQAIGILVLSFSIGGICFIETYAWTCVLAALYGFFGGVNVSLAAVVIIDFVSLKNMPRLLAVVMLIQGIGAAVGQPLLGALKDETGSFQSVNMVCAISSFVSGVLLLCYPLAVRLEYRRPPEFRLLPANSNKEPTV